MNKNGFVNIIIIGIIAIIIATAGYFALTRKIAEAPATNQETEIATETDNWETYRNEEYGFKVKVPPQAEVGRIVESDLISVIDNPIFGMKISNLIFVILKDTIIKNEAMEDFKYFENLSENPVETRFVGGEGGAPVIAVTPGSCNKKLIPNNETIITLIYCSGEGGFVTRGLIQDKNMVKNDIFVEHYFSAEEITSWEQPENSPTVNIEEKILSTFRFIE
ncbi:MAG: PsbP-related protein [Patescibacteria group bacterium]